MLTDIFDVHCPHCGEKLELAIEADVFGELVQDCEPPQSRTNRIVGLIAMRPYEGSPPNDGALAKNGTLARPPRPSRLSRGRSCSAGISNARNARALSDQMEAI